MMNDFHSTAPEDGEDYEDVLDYWRNPQKLQNKPQQEEEEKGELLSVELEDIVADPKNWSREKLDPEMVKRYARVYGNDKALMPPVHVALCDGGLYLFDGFHRYEAMKGVEIASIDALVFKLLEHRELAFRSAQCNLKNGVPLTNGELRKKAFAAYIKAGKHKRGNYRFKSYRGIALELGGIVSFSTVGRWLQKDFPAVYEAMRAQGEELKNPPEDYRVDKEQVTLKDAKELLKQAKARYKALTTVDAQEELLGAIEDTLKTLQGSPKVKLNRPSTEEETDF